MRLFYIGACVSSSVLCIAFYCIILLYVYTIVDIFIHLLMDTSFVSSFGVIQKTLL